MDVGRSFAVPPYESLGLGRSGTSNGLARERGKEIVSNEWEICSLSWRIAAGPNPGKNGSCGIETGAAALRRIKKHISGWYETLLS